MAAEELADLHRRLGAAARGQVLAHAREAANTALSRVKDRWALAACRAQSCVLGLGATSHCSGYKGA